MRRTRGASVETEQTTAKAATSMSALPKRLDSQMMASQHAFVFPGHMLGVTAQTQDIDNTALVLLSGVTVNMKSISSLVECLLTWLLGCFVRHTRRELDHPQHAHPLLRDGCQPSLSAKRDVGRRGVKKGTLPFEVNGQRLLLRTTSKGLKDDTLLQQWLFEKHNDVGVDFVPRGYGFMRRQGTRSRTATLDSGPMSVVETRLNGQLAFTVVSLVAGGTKGAIDWCLLQMAGST